MSSESPLSIQIDTLLGLYDRGDLDYTDYSDQAIRLAAQKLDQPLLETGSSPVHCGTLESLLASEVNNDNFYKGYSGLPSFEDRPEYQGQPFRKPANDAKELIERQFGPGYTPNWAILEICTMDRRTTGSHNKGIRENIKAVEPSDDVYAMWLLDFMGWKSVARMHEVYERLLRTSASISIPGDEVDAYWKDKVRKLAFFKGFAYKAFQATHQRAVEVYGETDADEALAVFRAAILFDTRKLSHKHPGAIREPILIALVNNDLEGAKALVRELVVRNPNAFPGKARRLFLGTA